MRHNALQGPITSISVGLSAMEARHRPCGDGKVVNDRDDDDAPGLLAIRAGAKLGDDQPLDIVLGLRKFFHDPHNNRLGLPGKITACGLCGVTEGETQWRMEIGNGDRRARYSKVLRDPSGEVADPGPFKALSTLPGLTRSVAVAPQPTGAWRVGNHGETKPQKSPDVRRRYRVGLVEKQTPSFSGMHKMRSRDRRSGQPPPWQANRD
jgi:hypothetical protein